MKFLKNQIYCVQQKKSDTLANIMTEYSCLSLFFLRIVKIWFVLYMLQYRSYEANHCILSVEVCQVSL